MTLLKDTFRGKVAALALAGSTLLATFSGSALGADDAPHCIPPNDPVAGQTYTLEQAKAMSASRGGRVVFFVTEANEFAADIATRGLARDGIRAVTVLAKAGEIQDDQARMLVAGLAPQKLIYPEDKLLDQTMTGKAEYFYGSLLERQKPNSDGVFISTRDDSSCGGHLE